MVINNSIALVCRYHKIKYGQHKNQNLSVFQIYTNYPIANATKQNKMKNSMKKLNNLTAFSLTFDIKTQIYARQYPKIQFIVKIKTTILNAWMVII